MSDTARDVRTSVLMITYNHKDFIAEAIESALKQKSTFRFELVIGDDFSHDGTREICQSYREAYPDIISLVLSDKNLGAHENFLNTLRSCRGKYIALLEGDDYWTDEGKLQKQTDFLDANPRFVLSFHDFVFLDREIIRRPSRFISRDRTEFELVRGATLHANTVVFRNPAEGIPAEILRSESGDTFLFAFLAASTGLGAAYAEGIKPSVYRLHSGGDWSNSGLLRKKKISVETYLLLRKVVNTRFHDVLNFKILSIKYSIAKTYLLEHSFLNFVKYLCGALAFAILNVTFRKPPNY